MNISLNDIAASKGISGRLTAASNWRPTAAADADCYTLFQVEINKPRVDLSSLFVGGILNGGGLFPSHPVIYFVTAPLYSIFKNKPLRSYLFILNLMIWFTQRAWPPMGGSPYFQGFPCQLRDELLEDHSYERLSPHKMQGIAPSIINRKLQSLEGESINF